MKAFVTRAPVGIALILIVSACGAPPLDVTSRPVDVSFSSKSATTGIEGYSAVGVRSYVKSDGKSVETSGVECSVKGSGFSTKVTTPGLVNLPDYGQKSRPVMFTCSYADSIKTVQSVPFNATSNANVQAGANGGILGALIMAGVNTARDKSDDDWAYPQVRVDF